MFKLGQEPLPVLVFEVGVFGKLSLDHQGFDVVDRVHIVHRILDNFANLEQDTSGSETPSNINFTPPFD